MNIQETKNNIQTLVVGKKMMLLASYYRLMNFIIDFKDQPQSSNDTHTSSINVKKDRIE